MTETRRGFTMITVLWVMSVASVVAMAGALAGRNGVNGERNRLELERAEWHASGCARRALAAIDSALRSGSQDEAPMRWRTLPRLIGSSPLLDPTCDLHLEAAGTKLDVNAASDEMIENLLHALGEDNVAMSVASLADWRDTDDVVRADGAERAWYDANHRMGPRNGPLADVRELARVRGFENLARYDTVLSAESGRISLATAPVSVLMAVPGITRETAEALVARHEAGAPVRDLLDVTDGISQPSLSALFARYADISRVTTADPDAWILTTSAASGAPPNRAVLEWRIARVARRGVVVRVRTLQ